MKILFTTLAALLLSAPLAFAHDSKVNASWDNGPYAQYPYYSTSVSCKTLKKAVKKHGSLVIFESPSIYGLFVSHVGHCPYDSDLKTDWVHSKTGKCAMYSCESSSNNY